MFPQYCFPGEYTIQGAGHGFDNNDMNMKSSFFALGPSFKQGYRKSHFESVRLIILTLYIDL